MKKLFLIILPLLILGYAVYSWGHYAWRQKITVTVDTPAGEVSGSAVSAVSWRKQWIPWDGMGWYHDLTGEAVVVEVKDNQYPMLVVFDDITDPASVQLVNPKGLAASFGPGMRMKAVSLEVTDEAVT